MERQMNNGIVLRNLQNDPLISRYFPRGLDESVFRKQLQDPQLLYKREDELLDLSDEELATWILPRESESPAEAPRQDEQEDAASRAGGSGGQRVSILIEDFATTAKIILSDQQDCPKPISLAEMEAALASHGITHGIQTEFLRRLSERPLYNRKFKIALGTLPVDGSDGEIHYHFDPSPSLIPKIRENDTVDYKSLDYAKSVREGELLCEITPPTEGQNGINIFGDILPGRDGKPVDISCGSNTAFSKDKRQIVATCDGQVTLRGNKIVVSKILMVEQVGPATGNILFAGTVQVSGDVIGGYTVRAGQDIIVKGIVEDATLVAGGNIVLCGGMKGHDTGLLDAGGDIRALFLENTRIRCLRCLYADVLLNCVAECGETISLSGKNGSLLGGSCTARRMVRSLSIGNEAHVPTNIFLKETGLTDKRHARLTLDLTRYRELLPRLDALAELPADTTWDTESFPAILARIVITRHRLQNSIRLMEEELAHEENGQISRTVVVREALFPNVSIEIDGVRFRSNALRYQCVAQRIRDRIVVRSGHYY